MQEGWLAIQNESANGAQHTSPEQRSGKSRFHGGRPCRGVASGAEGGAPTGLFGFPVAEPQSVALGWYAVGPSARFYVGHARIIIRSPWYFGTDGTDLSTGSLSRLPARVENLEVYGYETRVCHHQISRVGVGDHGACLRMPPFVVAVRDVALGLEPFRNFVDGGFPTLDERLARHDGGAGFCFDDALQADVVAEHLVCPDRVSHILEHFAARAKVGRHSDLDDPLPICGQKDIVFRGATYALVPCDQSGAVVRAEKPTSFRCPVK